MILIYSINANRKLLMDQMNEMNQRDKRRRTNQMDPMNPNQNNGITQSLLDKNEEFDVISCDNEQPFYLRPREIHSYPPFFKMLIEG